MLNFLKQIFTWWNQQTVGTFLYTLFKGKFVGSDNFGNKYYESSNGKRWVIYKNEVEATKITTEWHAWIHFMKNEKPTQIKEKYFWQSPHVENLTGTARAYKPKNAIMSDKRENKKKYDVWKP